MKYRVTINEAVRYEVDVEADSIDAARELGLEEHLQGVSVEMDNGAEVTDVFEIGTPVRTVRYPEVEVQLSTEDGNGFVIASRVRSAIERHVRSSYVGDQGEAYAEAARQGEAFFEDALSSSYDHILDTAHKWVTVR